MTDSQSSNSREINQKEKYANKAAVSIHGKVGARSLWNTYRVSKNRQFHVIIKECMIFGTTNV